MKTFKVINQSLIALAIVLTVSISANAQIGKLGNRLKNATKKISNNKKNISGTQTTNSSNIAKGKVFYVCKTGSARGEGSKTSPLKDIQKAIDKASNGDVVRIAEGNYLGTLDRGWIEIKKKYVSLEGGWNSDFSDRNPKKYITRIQPGPEQIGTIGRGVLLIDATSNKNSGLIIDGIFIDLGLNMKYQPATDDPRNGWPKGCETGRMLPNPPNKTIRLIGGKLAGKLIIRNCMFLNASYYAIIMTNMGGDWDIYNNVFVSNLYSSCEIKGGLNQNTGAHQSTVDFHHNTVMFTWPTTKEMESMGYGYRFRNGVDHKVHHNIFGCNNFGALDGGWDDSTLPTDKRKICSAYDNLFFMNRGDIVIAGTSGGNWLFVPGKRFDEVELLKKYENNREISGSSKFKDVIDQDYLKGFASLKIMVKEKYDANSAANQYRAANGLNKQGTITTRVTMFGNRYNFDKAVKFFGAEKDYGAQ